MRIEPVKTLGRSNLKRRGWYWDDDRRENRREKHPFQIALVPTETNRLEEEQDRFTGRYRPNSTFLTHLIANRDNDEAQTNFMRQTASAIGTSRYRETAASPRKRAVGHLIAIEY
ncbi:hypothetical protein [Roseibium algae]|uniref:Uncharacterized protein n=1 Tax=Roseibium algae TaxID=3123038 RepID=A0ABU8TQA5_9HYPH